MDDKKIITGFVFNMRETTFTWNSKNKSIITLSTCEAVYVAIIAYVYYFIWLKRLLKKLRMLQKKKPTKIYMNNSSVIALAKNPVFHDKSKHIDTTFHYLRECSGKKKVEVKNVKTQDQVTNIFTKPLEYDVFAKMRDMLRVINNNSS